MVTVKIEGGTPQGFTSLCVTCRWAQIVKGFSASEERVICGAHYGRMQVPFLVSQCSEFDDKSLPSKRDMELIAWILLTKQAGRSIGFVTAKEYREIEGENAEIIPAAAIRPMPVGE